MDFNQLDSKAVADRGTWMHVKSAVDGKPLYDGEVNDEGVFEPDKSKPCKVKVLGADGDIAQSILAAQRRDMRDSADDAEENPQEANRLLVQHTGRLIVDFMNINNGDRPADAPADNEWFLKLNKAIKVPGAHPSFVEQVRDHALKRHVALGKSRGG